MIYVQASSSKMVSMVNIFLLQSYSCIFFSFAYIVALFFSSLFSFLCSLYVCLSLSLCVCFFPLSVCVSVTVQWTDCPCLGLVAKQERLMNGSLYKIRNIVVGILIFFFLCQSTLRYESSWIKTVICPYLLCPCSIEYLPLYRKRFKNDL